MAGNRLEVHSAGTAPSRVRSEAIEALRDLNIDIGGQRSEHVDEFLGQPFDYVITVCDNAKEQCPVFPDTNRIHWSFDDPTAHTGSPEHRLAAFPSRPGPDPIENSVSSQKPRRGPLNFGLPSRATGRPHRTSSPSAAFCPSTGRRNSVPITSSPHAVKTEL